jgi:long-chain acyl-CoA synthetase
MDAGAATLPEFLRRRAALTPAARAYLRFQRASGTWEGVAWAEVAALVARWQGALLGEALAPGARVAILVPNCLEHVGMDQAALALGLATVPLHAVDNPESIAYILADSGAAVLLVDTAERWARLAPLRERFPTLQRVVCLEGSGQGCVGAQEWLAAAPAAAGRGADVTPGTLASIVYTSGTTGRPKGVMLTHRNVVANVAAVLSVVSVETEDLFLSFLPLSHTFERTIGYYLPIAAGACVAHARSVATLAEDLRVVRPTILVSVPRIYERIHAAIDEQLRAGGPLGRALFARTEEVGWRRFRHGQDAQAPYGAPDRLQWAILRRLVAGKVLDRFGGRVRLAITGGAPMAEPVARRLLAVGLTLLQGYGMTEASPVVSANLPEDNDPLTVGKPLPGVAVKVGDNDELLVKGANVMAGYWRRPEDTARAIDADGWLHTGDQASLEQGRVRIKGRIKDIIVTSTGEKIAPADLELAITADPLFAQAMVIGEQRPFIAALAVLDGAAWRAEAAKLGLDPSDRASLRSPKWRSFALARMREAVKTFPSYATPRAAYFDLDPWTIPAGLMTPTLKLKRPALQARYASEIESLYSGK